MTTINQKAALEVFERLSLALIKQDPTQTYNGNNMMSLAVKAMIEEYNLNQSHLETFLVIREKFEHSLDTRFKIKRQTFGDLESQMVKRKVPQLFRVMNGMMDMLIGSLFLEEFV